MMGISKSPLLHRCVSWLPGAILALLFLLVVSGLSGCAEFTAARRGAATHSAQAADAALDVAKWQTCAAASIGSLERELGADTERIIGWMLYCGKKPGLHPLLPPNAPKAMHQGMPSIGGPNLLGSVL